MASKPILFSTPMVQAILEGRKTQTRRVCKALENYDFSWGLDRKPYIGDYKTFAKVAPRKWDNVTLENVWLYDLQTAVDESKTYVLKLSYQPGDILWVRETWCNYNNKFYYKADKKCYGCTEDGICMPRGIESHITCELCESVGVDGYIRWRPSIHMPREAARIFLRVTNVRVERLQDITEEDAKAEGCHERLLNDGWKNIGKLTARDDFIMLWEYLNAKRGYGWDTNPWVWVIEFERVSEDGSSKDK